MTGSFAEAQRHLTRPDVTPAELAAIASDHPGLRLAVAAHPNAYPELRAWIAQVTPPAAPLAAAPTPQPVPAAAPAALSAAPLTPMTPPRRARLPWIVAAVAVVVALAAVGALALRSPAAGSGIAEHGSATPEAAATFFADAFAAGDLEAAASAFASESLVDGYSFEAYLERSNAYMPPTMLPADQYRALDLGKRGGDIANSLTQLVRSALMPGLAPDVTYSPLDGEGDGMSIATFTDGLNPAGFSSISVARVDVIDTVEGTTFAENQAKQMAPFGADAARTVGVLFDTADGTAVLGMQVIEYDGSWYVWDLSGGILGTDLYTVAPISTGDYLEMMESARAAAAGS